MRARTAARAHVDARMHVGSCAPPLSLSEVVYRLPGKVPPVFRLEEPYNHFLFLSKPSDLIWQG